MAEIKSRNCTDNKIHRLAEGYPKAALSEKKWSSQTGDSEFCLPRPAGFHQLSLKLTQSLHCCPNRLAYLGWLSSERFFC